MKRLKILAILMVSMILCVTAAACTNRTKSSEKEVTALSASGLSGVVISENTVTASAAHTISAVTLSVTVSDKASYKIYTDSACATQAPAEITLNTGANVLYILVTAEDATTAKYMLTISKAAAPVLSAAKAVTAVAGTGLNNLVINEAAKTITADTVNPVSSVSDVSVTVSANASYKIYKGTDEVTTLTLDAGANEFIITVTAEDGSTQDYALTVTRAAAPVLSAAKAVTAVTGTGLNNIVITEAAKTITADTVNSVSSVSDISVTVSANASYKIYKSTDEVTTLTLDAGANVFTVTVTAEDGSAQDYTFTVTRAAALSAEKELISITGTGLTNLVINESNKTATAGAAYKTGSIADISVTVSGGAEYDIYSGEEKVTTLTLDAGANEFVITVTAEDGSAQDYLLTVTRAAAAAGKAVTAVTGTGLTNVVIDEEEKTITGSVALSVTSISNISATVSDLAAYKLYSGVNEITSLTLAEGANVFKITVTAENGDTQDYVLTVTRPVTFIVTKDQDVFTGIQFTDEAKALDFAAGSRRYVNSVVYYGAKDYRITYELSGTVLSGTGIWKVAGFSLISAANNEDIFYLHSRFATANSDAYITAQIGTAWTPTLSAKDGSAYHIIPANTYKFNIDRIIKNGKAYLYITITDETETVTLVKNKELELANAGDFKFAFGVEALKYTVSNFSIEETSFVPEGRTEDFDYYFGTQAYSSSYNYNIETRGYTVRSVTGNGITAGDYTITNKGISFKTDYLYGLELDEYVFTVTADVIGTFDITINIIIDAEIDNDDVDAYIGLVRRYIELSALMEGEYTPESWEVFNAALIAAEECLNGEDAKSIAEAAADLDNAEAALEPAEVIVMREDGTAMNGVAGIASDYTNWDTVKAAVLALNGDATLNTQSKYDAAVAAEHAKLVAAAFTKLTEAQINTRYNAKLFSEPAAAKITAALAATAKSVYEGLIDELEAGIQYGSLDSGLVYTDDVAKTVTLSMGVVNYRTYDRVAVRQIPVTGNAYIIADLKADIYPEWTKMFVSFVDGNFVNDIVAELVIFPNQTFIDFGAGYAAVPCPLNGGFIGAKAATVFFAREVNIDGYSVFTIRLVQDNTVIAATTFTSTHKGDGYFAFGIEAPHLAACKWTASNIHMYGEESLTYNNISTVGIVQPDNNYNHMYRMSTLTFDGDFSAELVITGLQIGNNAAVALPIHLVSRTNELLVSTIRFRFFGAGWLWNNDANQTGFPDRTVGAQTDIYKLAVTRISGEVTCELFISGDGGANWISLAALNDPCGTINDDEVFFVFGVEWLSAVITVTPVND